MKNKFKVVFALILVISLTLVLSSCGFPVYFNHYSVSGIVQDSEGKPIMNAAIKFDNGYSSTSSDEDGYWQRSGLGGSVIIKAEKAGHSFTPSQYPVNQNETNINFTSNQIVPEKYEISGRVEDGEGNGIGDIVIRFSDGYAPTTTDSSGNWEKDNLSGDITVTPNDNEYVFDPASRSVSGPDSYVNFVGTESSKTYSISGKVEDQQENGLRNVIIRFSGGFESIKTDEEGNWEKDGLEGEVTVTPEQTDYSFDPASRTVSGPDNYMDFLGTYTNTDYYNVEGYVYLEDSNEGVPGVEITFESMNLDKQYSTVVTDHEGKWSKTNLQGQVKIIPELEGWNITPTEKIITIEDKNSSINFNAYTTSQYEFYGVSGKVIDKSVDGLSGIKLTFRRDGELVWITFTDTEGEFTVGEYLWGEITIIPDPTSNYTFEPDQKVIEQDSTGVNFQGTWNP